MASRETRFQRLGLLVGLLAFILALNVAINSPPREYELSIYAATPDLFWIAIGLTVVTATAVAFHPRSPTRLVATSSVLAATAVWTIVALPAIRGYFFYSGGDALSHLGFARSFATRAMSPTELLHPGVHLTSLMIAGGTAFDLTRAMMLAPFLFVALFFVFVPVCVRMLSEKPGAARIGLFIALLLIPINNVATHNATHPSSQAIMFLPLMLFLLFLYLRQDPETTGRWTPVGVMLTIASLAAVLIHPEEALNIIFIFLTIVSLQFIARRLRPTHQFARHRPIYFQTLFIVVTFLVWAPRSPRVQGRVELAYETLLFARAAPGGEVTGRTTSLATLGGSIEELFVKLFLVAFVLSIVAGIFMLLTVAGRFDDELPDDNAFAKYLSFSFVPLLGVTAVVFLASFGDHYFRFIGFLMAIVTILAAVAISRGLPTLSGRGHSLARVAVVVVFLLVLPLTALAAHPSPWIYQSSPQVTETSMAGYQTSFDQRAPDITYEGISGGVDRYVEATYGPDSRTTETFPVDSDGIPQAVFATNLTTHYDDPRYIPVTEQDTDRELGVYQGFRYSAAGFEQFSSTPGISRVQSNGDFRLYLLEGESAD